MKNKIIRSIFALVLILVAMPMMGQDYMEVFLKDGKSRIFHLKEVMSISTSYSDENNIYQNQQFQHINTALGEYVYAIDDIDSIAFTKYDVEKVKESVTSALSGVVSVLKNCETLDDVVDYIDQIKEVERVNDVWSNGHELFVDIANWGVTSFHFSHQDLDEQNLSKIITKAKKQISKLRSYNSESGEPIKIVIANQVYNDDRYSYNKEIISDLDSMFADCDISIEYEKKPTVDFFKTKMFDNNIVFLITHGGYNPLNNEHSLATAEQLGILPKLAENEDIPPFTQTMVDNYNSLLEKYHVTKQHIAGTFFEEERNGQSYWVCYVRIKEPFYEQKGIVEGRFPDFSIFFNTACESLSNNENLAHLLNDRNLGVYMGYNATNTVGSVAGAYFLRNLLKGYSVDKSFIEIPDDYREQWYPKNASIQTFAQLEMVTKSNDETSHFLTSPYTENIGQEEVNQEYNSSKAVTIRGKATLLDFDNDAIKPGFTLSYYDPVENTQFVNAEIEPVFYENKVVFYATLTGLLPNRTYHYRAYTYDGLHRNYGDICTFKIDEKQSDTRVQMLTGTVNNATYSIYKEITDESDYHENPDGWKCYRSKLTLDITKNGTTNTYVVDDNIYLDKETQHHGGQVPCMMLDYNKNKMYIFCNSKDGQPYYSMDGNFYSSSINNISFSKETVFEGANFGWYPYFRDSGNDEIHLCHFSYAGYFTILAKRNTSNEWTLYYDNPEITPEDAIKEWEQVPHVLVIGTP